MLRYKGSPRCNFRITAGLVLMTGAVVLGNLPEPEAPSGPTRIQTLNDRISACNRKGVETVIGRLGCTPQKSLRGNSGSVRILRVGQ